MRFENNQLMLQLIQDHMCCPSVNLFHLFHFKRFCVRVYPTGLCSNIDTAGTRPMALQLPETKISAGTEMAFIPQARSMTPVNILRSATDLATQQPPFVLFQAHAAVT